jgi:uncharacterized protein
MTTHARLALACLVAALAGCASASSRFYTLDATATGAAASASSYAVLVGPVTVPAAVDRPEFVVQVAPNRVELAQFNRWAGPLGDGIARALAGDLSAVLGTPDVAVAPLANFIPTHRVTVDVQRFESIPGQAVLVDAVWTVHRAGSTDVRSGRSTAREAVQEKGFDALAAAHSRALAQMSADIAAAIRATAVGR